eukprot:CAMPEP_0170585110 /NCGR_PEP_ID=MMETSP0224-20130122/9037_1 /TAXON_ID=285029 /ORGANISM="Togula jolla, Strain CCCM 725" /LENGTH=136 /DNA_ID=CAMNT_0010908569 /DNA_START=1733 /DNA_END=2141 /DNA_ORIENTATION=+
MPMKTTRRTSELRRCAALTCSTIAQAGKFAEGFTPPVSQKLQSNGQPACEETQTVAPLRLTVWPRAASHGWVGLTTTTVSARSLRHGRSQSRASKSRLPPPAASKSCRNTLNSLGTAQNAVFEGEATASKHCRPLL